MKDKKVKLQKFLSLFLALIMLCQIPLTSFNIYATENTDTSIESSEISDESLTEEFESTEISNSEEKNLLNDIEIISEEEEENTDNWEIGLVFYDSSVDGGNTPLTEINWDGNIVTDTRIVNIQITYKNTNVVTSYDIGELAIVIPNLLYKSSGLTGTVMVGANISTTSGQPWDFASTKAPSSDFENFIFTNAIPIEAGTPFIGSIQIEYTLKLSHYPEKFIDSCIKQYQKNLKATLRETCPKATEPTISLSDLVVLNYSTDYLEYTDPNPETTQLRLRFSEYSYFDTKK